MIAPMQRMVDLCWPAALVRLRLRWRRCRKRGAGIRVLVSSYEIFSRQLEKSGIRHALLRGSCPRSGRTDFDILSDYRDTLRLLRVASGLPGRIPVDVYFDFQPSVDSYCYFPPALASQILEASIIGDNGLRSPRPQMQFFSLAYHVLYHKGINEQLSNPLKDTITSGSHYAELRGLSTHPEVCYDRPLDMLSLHEFLDERGWSMPRDLLARWPRQHRFLQLLGDLSLRKLYAINEQPKDIIFLVREDSNREDILDVIQDQLSEACIVTVSRSLSDNERQRLANRTRGGNWYEKISGCYRLVGPTHLFLCTPTGKNDIDKFCTTALVPLKQRIREEINRRFPSREGKRFVLHAGDDAWDSLEYSTLLDTAWSNR
jgi:hypothetical protein